MRQLDATVLKDLPHRRVGVDERPLKPPNPGRALEHGDVEAEADAIEKMAIFDSSDIDTTIRPVYRQPRHRFVVARRHADGLREVVTGSRGNQRKAAVGAGPDYCVGDLTPGSVAADGDDRRRAFVQRTTCECCLISRLRRALKR